MKKYIYKKYIYNEYGDTIGCQEIEVPNDIVNQIRAEVIEECIQLYKEMRPRLATSVTEFGDKLEALKEQAND